jgi:hypothetical protein
MTRVMNNSLHVVDLLRDHLNRLMTKSALSSGEMAALERDITYLDKCASVLATGNINAVNDLWREVQYLSRFFGEGYAEGDDERYLYQLMHDFHTALLDETVALRSKQ